MKYLIRPLQAVVFIAVSLTLYAGNPDTLYYVCDGTDELWKINRTNGGTLHVGALGTSSTESIAYWDDVLYATNAGDFGTINTSTGAYTIVEDVDTDGAAQGAAGGQDLDDIDGLSFDPWTGILWASQRRSGDYDLLFQIDPTTGKYIQDAFGTNVDYIVIDGSGVYEDIDDIAVSPVDGKMYTIQTNAGTAQVLEINKYFGTVTVKATVDRTDVEGLAYHNDGTFWGTSGTGNTFFQINVNTGATSNVTDISATAPPGDCSDPESASALVADVNTVSGQVWDDVDFDGVLDGGETGLSGITVNMYYDADADGVLETSDILIQTTTTDGSGNYSFQFATTASLLVEITQTTLPAGYAMTTDNIETAVFADAVNFGETDSGHNFGAASGPDSDGDGIPDFFETTTADSDFDGVADYLDLDSDNDGILDSVEGILDSDDDGILDYLDLDSDNDGIPDAIEANSGVEPTGYDDIVWRITGTDGDGDGLLDDVDNAPAVAYGAGSTSTLAGSDSDGDGYEDFRDLDSDGDGITDIIEAGGTDSDNDGHSDSFTDANADGMHDPYFNNNLTVPNTDGTGNPDYLDWDSDDDGIDDRTEGFSTSGYSIPLNNDDCDFDGLIDWFDVAKGGTPAPPVDTDSDGTPDYQDTDSDGDGNPDSTEGHDTDGDGTPETTAAGNDADGDGIDDAFDTNDAVWGSDQSAALPNQDSDSEPDFRDKDDLTNPGVFYFVCDGSDELYSINHFNGNINFIGGVGVPDIEAIAYWDGVLYAADAGDFGTLSTTTGAFTLIADVDVDGPAGGADGNQNLTDIDGLSFDPWTGVLWASQRRNGNFDLLFQIDPATGKYIQNAFGTGIDYVVVDGSGVYQDIDDIAVSPTNGNMYTVGNDGSQDQLLTINKYTGSVNVVVANLTQQDVEGMGYFNDGTFWGTVGTSPGSFWEINPSSGNMTDEVTMSCNDPESIAALVAPPNRISGTVWEDADFDETIGGTENGISGVTVNLYYDTDCDGTLDAGEVLLQSEVTDANGDYSFEFGTTACLTLRVDLTTLPAGYALTTDNAETVVFADNVNFEESDTGNNFGAATDSDCDSDGIPDFAEGGVNADEDGDGVDNMCDLDSDNDGILDSQEGTGDTDFDGVPDYFDFDSDNDGIPDAIEANNGSAIAEYDSGTGNLSGTDADGDGLLDAVDADPGVQYGGGSESTFDNADHDNDGVVDSKDLDSDNDCIVDAIEAGGSDSDGNGYQDGFTDGNIDGLSDLMTTNPLDIDNTDGIGLPDYIDFDSDEDGLDDALEGMAMGSYEQPTTYLDADGDGLLDVCDSDFGSSPISPVDTDSDGIPDFQDTDSDGDGITDFIEGNDSNMDGVADYALAGTDTDGDGIDDNFDSDCIGSTYSVTATDYGEEDTSDGSMNLASSDLELTYDGVQQEAGVYFPGIQIPQGTTINSAYIQFQADEDRAGALTINIQAENLDDAAPFTTANSDISNRTARTTLSTWSPNDWTLGDAGADQQTPDITSHVQAIVNRAGWASGNDMVFIFTGSGTNRRTAEVNPTIYIDFVGSTGSTWGCLTNTPHQDTDGDGTDDWRDVDDDGDGILSADEGADIDGNGTPDYLEVAVCPAGQTAETVNGNADAVVGSNNLSTSGNNSLGAPDGTFTVFNGNDNSRVDLDLTDLLTAGTTIDVTWSKFSGGGNAELDVFWSDDNVTYNTLANMLTNSTTAVTTTITLSNDTRYLRFQRDRRRPQLDGLAYAATVCSDDFDMDGIPDIDDEDDDNDGISDIVEGAGALDTDGDGLPNSKDIDSDNDGLPDAVEANGGTLPADMLDEGHYPAAFIANAANDVDGDGWYESTEGGQTYASNIATQVDTDSDGFFDYIDLDADGDCIPDATEANDGDLPSNMDQNGQYTVAYANTNDVDNDGYVDDLDADQGGTPLENNDTDGDGNENYIDTDADGDGVSDSMEAYDPDIASSILDTDADGLTNNCDPDAGGTSPNMPDEDCNTIADYLDAGKVSDASGNYTTAAIWSNNVVPVSGKSITIATPNSVTLTGNTTVGSVFIQNSATLNLSGFELTILGDLTVDGTLTTTNGRVIMNGTCQQDICGNIVFDALEIDNTSGVNVTCGCIVINDVLDLEEGELDVCSASCFTLASNGASSGTAYIDATGSGTITCDVERERYKQGCAYGYMSVATPYSTNTPADWGDDLPTAGIPGGPYSGFPNPSIYYYDETVTSSFDGGWTGVPHYTAYNLERGVGYYMYAGPSDLPGKLKVNGTVDMTPFTFNLTYTSTGNGDEDGWHLLGNPYPSAIDWDASAGWSRVGCCNSIWVWNECNDQFAAYIDGSATNGGTNVVESSQAFWMKAHLPGASMTINRSAITTDNGDFRLDSYVQGNLTVHVNGFAQEDEFVLRLDNSAEHGHDDFGDAVNLLSPETNMAIYTVDDDGMNCAINAFPNDGVAKVIPVMLRVPDTGSYTLDFSEQLSFPEEICMVLIDNETGTLTDMTSTMFYTFDMDALPNPIRRFDIVFTYPVNVESKAVSCHGNTDGEAYYDVTGTGPFDLVWTDSDGNVVYQQIGVSVPDTVFNLSGGLYTLELTDHGAPFCNQQTVEFTVEEPASLLTVSSAVTNETCGMGTGGAINISVYGGQSPYVYRWSNSETTQDITNLSAGVYSVEIMDVNGCTEMVTETVLSNSSVTAGFNIADHSVDIAAGQLAVFTNNSVGASHYRWDFGDGSDNSTQPNPVHLYDSVGVFPVTLIASQGPCTDTTKFLVHAYDESLSVETPHEDLMNMYWNGNEFVVESSSENLLEGTIEILDISGKLINKKQLNGTTRIYRFGTTNLPDGIYIMRFASAKFDNEQKVNLIR